MWVWIVGKHFLILFDTVLFIPLTVSRFPVMSWKMVIIVLVLVKPLIVVLVTQMIISFKLRIHRLLFRCVKVSLWYYQIIIILSVIIPVQCGVMKMVYVDRKWILLPVVRLVLHKIGHGIITNVFSIITKVSRIS
jgi:hypothetical protein